MVVVVLIGSLFVIGISCLVIDTILEMRSYHKAISIPKYHAKPKASDDVDFNIEILMDDDEEESYTVL